MPSLVPWLLLAESRPLFYLGDRFDPGRSQINISAVGALTAAMALAAFIAWVWSRRSAPRERKVINDPHKLLAELGQTHGLTRQQTVLLGRIAGHFRLAQPALVFVDPALLQKAANQAASEPVRQTIEKIRVKLFAGGEAKAAQGGALR
jgi:hypothetical protein